MRVRGDVAWEQTLQNRAHRWTGERFHAPLLSVSHRPKFSIARDAHYFCIGSCFARNIEEHLLISGASVLSKRAKCPPKEGGLRNNGWLNKFTTASMLNDILWAASPPKYDESWFEKDASGWRDLQLSPGVSPVDDVQYLVDQRRYISEDYFARISLADVLILTLGLNETWWDDRNQRFLNATPQRSVVRQDPERFWLVRTDAQANANALEAIYITAQSIRPGIKLVVTVSPVPMETTFSGEDILLANSFSKATLLAAARSFASNHADVDYYPSFEMVALSSHDDAYAADGVHVRNDLVARVTADFIEYYSGTRPENSENFQELAYLSAHPDVERAVKAGEIGSGYEHWISTGRTEGRSLRATETTDRMRSAGAI